MAGSAVVVPAAFTRRKVRCAGRGSSGCTQRPSTKEGVGATPGVNHWPAVGVAGAEASVIQQPGCAIPPLRLPTNRMCTEPGRVHLTTSSQPAPCSLQAYQAPLSPSGCISQSSPVKAPPSGGIATCTLPKASVHSVSLNSRFSVADHQPWSATSATNGITGRSAYGAPPTCSIWTTTA